MARQKTKTIKAVLPPQYETYKASAGVASEAEMTEEQIKKIYALAVEEFLKGDISTDGISAIFNRLFTRVTKLPGENSDLLNAIIAGSELSFYIRKPELHKQFTGFLKEVLTYKETLTSYKEKLQESSNS